MAYDECNDYEYVRDRACIRELSIMCDDCMMGYKHWHWCNMKYYELELVRRVKHYPSKQERVVLSAYLEQLDKEKKRKRVMRLCKQRERLKKNLLKFFCIEGYEFVKRMNNKWNVC